MIIGKTEALFHTYAQFASKTDIEPKPNDEERRTEEQLHEILEKVHNYTNNNLLAHRSNAVDND